MKVTLEEIIISKIHNISPIKFWHPKIKNYRYRTQHGFYIIDLVKAQQRIHYIAQFLTIVSSEGKNILLVPGVANPIEIVRTRANAAQIFFVIGRWRGGTLTNWKITQRSLLTFHRLSREEKNGLWTNVAKQNATLFHGLLQHLTRHLAGIAGMHSYPGAVVIFDCKTSLTPIKECSGCAIPIICPVNVTYYVKFTNIILPINTNSMIRIHLFLEVVVSSIADGRRWWMRLKVHRQKTNRIPMDKIRDRISD